MTTHPSTLELALRRASGARDAHTTPRDGEGVADAAQVRADAHPQQASVSGNPDWLLFVGLGVVIGLLVAFVCVNAGIALAEVWP